MKKLIPLFLLSIFFIRVNAQCIHSCCSNATETSSSSSTNAAFASLASDVAFQNAHESPLPANYAAIGRIITFPTPDGKSAKAYFVPAKNQTKNYLIVIHEWWGLNDWIKKESDMFADSLGVNVMALDLYDGQVATNSDEATKLTQSNDATRTQNIIKGAIQFTGKDSKIATIGWCWGGGWSLQTAMIANDHLKGCVMFYGMPETDVSKLKGLNSDVLFIWAEKDKWINEQVKNDFVKNMNAAGKKLTVKEYDADHAFANPSNPSYNKTAGDDATRNAITFLKSHFSM